MTSEGNGMPGVFITFEGGEGSGKSTHIRFLADALRSQGKEVLCLREPGATRIGEALRAVVLDDANQEMCSECELLIYEAARAQIVHECILPALHRGAVVLCDRFRDSSLAYQGYGRGLSLEFVEQASNFACKGLMPQRTILMKASNRASVGLQRATCGVGADRMEQAGLDFHIRVNAAFDDLSGREPGRVRVVESAARKPETARLVFAAVADLFGWDPENLPFTSDFFEQAKYYHGKRPPSVPSDCGREG